MRPKAKRCHPRNQTSPRMLPRSDIVNSALARIGRSGRSPGCDCRLNISRTTNIIFQGLKRNVEVLVCTIKVMTLRRIVFFCATRRRTMPTTTLAGRVTGPPTKSQRPKVGLIKCPNSILILLYKKCLTFTHFLD